MPEKQYWFAVRTIFQHGQDGSQATFEEKITVYRSANAEAALRRASVDVDRYLELNREFVPIKQLAVYELGRADIDLDGVEVWSYLCNGPADIEEFYREKYQKFDLEMND